MTTRTAITLPGLEIDDGFDLIKADPPWRFVTRSRKGITAKGAGGQYRTMSLEDIKSMPVGQRLRLDCAEKIGAR